MKALQAPRRAPAAVRSGGPARQTVVLDGLAGPGDAARTMEHIAFIAPPSREW